MIKVESATFALKIFVAQKIKKDVAKKRNPKKMKKKSKNCKNGTCFNHPPKKVEDGFLYERCSSS